MYLRSPVFAANSVNSVNSPDNRAAHREPRTHPHPAGLPLVLPSMPAARHPFGVC